VADAGATVGLGHISRSSSITVALRSRGIECRCYATGVAEPFERDGVRWDPLDGPYDTPGPTDVVVVDSYLLQPDKLASLVGPARLVVLHDRGTPPRDAAIVVAAAADSDPADDRRLGGLAYAALRPDFWGLPRRTPGPVRRIVVTTGAGSLGGLGCELARALSESLPNVEVAVVRGPHATFDAPAGIDLVDAPESLLSTLLAADLVVSAAGQTMLEAAACGTPCIALPLVDNQRDQARRLAELGAVRLVDPPEAREVVAAAQELVADVEARRELSRNARSAVDGYGALRVAFHVARLVEESR
jgi:UDP-2,4-diacetamido-2,4,6-trideoxy-beta-L-altropyranose hydrolase